jgi:hypothetical protein
MPELEALLAQLHKRIVAVVAVRRDADGQAPAGYVEELTAAWAAVREYSAAVAELLNHVTDAVRVAKVGDVFGGPSFTTIPANVLEFVDSENTRWRRPEDEAEATGDGQVYDWITEGGWSTTEGCLSYYAPIEITKVRTTDA